MRGICVIRRSGQGWLEREIAAQEAIWREGNWVLRNGVVREFGEENKLKTATQFEEKKITLPLSPEDLWQYKRDPSWQSIANIKKYLREAEQAGSFPYAYLTEYHARCSLPLINFTLLILSLPFCLLSLQQNIVGRVGWALGFALIYYIFFSLMVALARQGALYPPIAVWLPNVVFLSLGLFYLWKKR